MLTGPLCRSPTASDGERQDRTLVRLVCAALEVSTSRWIASAGTDNPGSLLRSGPRSFRRWRRLLLKGRTLRRLHGPPCRFPPHCRAPTRLRSQTRPNHSLSREHHHSLAEGRQQHLQCRLCLAELPGRSARGLRWAPGRRQLPLVESGPSCLPPSSLRTRAPPFCLVAGPWPPTGRRPRCKAWPRSSGSWSKSWKSS